VGDTGIEPPVTSTVSMWKWLPDRWRADGRRYRHGTLTGYSLGKCHCEHRKAAYAHYRPARRLEGKDDPRRGRPLDTDGHIPRGWFRKRVWKPALSTAGIDRRVRIHDLRHAPASWLLSGGADLQVVKERLATAASVRPRGTSTPCRTLTTPHSTPSPRCVIDEAQDEHASGCVTPKTPSASYRSRNESVARAHAYASIGMFTHNRESRSEIATTGTQFVIRIQGAPNDALMFVNGSDDVSGRIFWGCGGGVLARGCGWVADRTGMGRSGWRASSY
jgi:hypothetical protein